MERVKRALEYWPALVVIATLLSAGWGASAFSASKGSAIKQQDLEDRMVVVEVALKDVQIIKLQMWANAVHVGAPVITSIPDGGIR